MAMSFWERFFGLKIYSCGAFSISDTAEQYYEVDLKLGRKSKSPEFDRGFRICIYSPQIKESPLLQRLFEDRGTKYTAGYLGEIRFKIILSNKKEINIVAKPPVGTNGTSESIKLAAFRLEGPVPSGKIKLYAKIIKMDEELINFLDYTELWIVSGGTK